MYPMTARSLWCRAISILPTISSVVSEGSELVFLRFSVRLELVCLPKELVCFVEVLADFCFLELRAVGCFLVGCGDECSGRHLLEDLDESGFLEEVDDEQLDTAFLDEIDVDLLLEEHSDRGSLEELGGS